MPKLAIRGMGAKPYTIAMVGQNDAEINMYGEVVQTRPVDWWTGEPVPGNFICVDEFLNELSELSSKDNITVHINSVGGDFYAGLAIYNRLRNLSASVTTINDGLAASAGSIIFMAGDKGKRKVHAGSNLMIHGVLTLLWGYYNAVELRNEAKTLDAHNKVAIAAYVEATGLDQETVKAAMCKDTYMTGQEAVDSGWADEVITGDDAEPVNMKLTPDKSRLMVNGHAVAACLFGKLPDGIPQMTAEEFATMTASGEEPPLNSAEPAPQVCNHNSKNGGIENMEIKNVEDLRKAYPDLVTQVENAAQANGANAERQRIQGIESIQNAIGDAEMVKNAKFGEKPMNAQELAFAAMQKQAAVGAKMLGSLNADTKNSGTGEVVPAPAAPQAKTEDEQAAELLFGAIKNMKEGK